MTKQTRKHAWIVPLTSSLLILVVFAFVYKEFPPQKEYINQSSAGTDIVAFGDSLVEGVGSDKGGGFVTILSEKSGERIINLGRAGDKTEDALARINELDNYNPKVVLILMGGNDYFANVPNEQIFENLGKIVDEVHRRGAQVILLGLQAGPFDFESAEEFRQLANEKRVVYIPNMMRRIFGNRDYMSDILHPNDRGYEVIADRILPVLNSVLETN